MDLEFIKAMSEFVQELDKIKKENRQEEYKETANELYKLYEALSNAGFSEEMVNKIFLLMIEKGLNGDNNE